jgi:predicted nucleotidyltransferase
MKEVRVSERDLHQIKEAFIKHFISGDKLWIFGSRVDATKKGGDIDLYIETHANSIEEAVQRKINFIWELEKKIGEQKIDVVLNILMLKSQMQIYRIASNNGIRIV